MKQYKTQQVTLCHSKEINRQPSQQQKLGRKYQAKIENREEPKRLWPKRRAKDVFNIANDVFYAYNDIATELSSLGELSPSVWKEDRNGLDPLAPKKSVQVQDLSWGLR